MIFRRPSNRYGRTDVPETPYQKAGQLWDERIGTARVQARNWRLMALVNGALSIGLAIGLVWQGARSSVTPYVVEVTEIGEVRAVGPAIEQYTPSDAQIAPASGRLHFQCALAFHRSDRRARTMARRL
jgi:type IV secretory pathway TrbF-like protein